MRTVQFFATYYKQKDSALNLVQSLMRQTSDNWKLTICSNGDTSLFEFRDEIFNKVYGSDNRVEFVVTEQDTGSWGALNRRSFIQNNLSDNDLLVNTSVEDYYVPTTVSLLNKYEHNFLYWDFTHHHFGYNTISAITQPRISKIDWGNFAVIGSIAKQIDLDDEKWKAFVADGIFVESIFVKFPDITNMRIPKILFVKN